jgi:hypothetical protein
VKLTTHLHLVLRSRIRGAIPPLPQYVFMAWCLVKHGDSLTFTFTLPTNIKMSRDRSVGIALGYVLDDRGSRVRFSAGFGNFTLHHRVQNGSGAHPASCPISTRNFFSRGKAAGS